MAERLPGMKVDVLGCVKATKVPTGAAFLPVFEAVVNSIHSTQDKYGEDVGRHGQVEVRIHRVMQVAHEGTGRPPVPGIAAVTITDNGVGFDDANLRSFETAYSTWKADRGGKGVGRFSWLVVFKRAVITSTFLRDNTAVERRFVFRCTPHGIEDYEEGVVRLGTRQTTRVVLEEPFERYWDALRLGTEVIAERLFQHCFNYFVMAKCPAITVIDEGPEETTSVNVNAKIDGIKVTGPVDLPVGDHALQLLHVQRGYHRGLAHEAHLCANERVVESFALSEVSDLGKEPIPGDGELPVLHHVYVSGKALDEAVDATRTRLDIPSDAPLLAQAGLLDMASLRTAIGAVVNEHLGPVIEAQQEENYQKISHHVRTVQQEYRHLLKHRPDQLRRVRWTDDERKLDQELYRVKQDWDAEVRRRGADIEERLEDENADPDLFADELHRVVQDVNEAGQADLVRYVVRRRAVLKIIRHLLKRTSGPALEEHVHRVVFPMRATADEIPYEDHNLWLLDDALACYEFVASDLQFKQCPPAPSDSTRRPDILAFKVGDQPYQHVVLVEFKRPERKDENPVQQLVDYAVLLREGRAKNADGVTMPGIPQGVRIDAYAVATLTPELEMKMRTGPGNMVRVDGAWRWSGGMPAENLTIEVLDFNAFATRAEQRNRAFFNKLGLR